MREKSWSEDEPEDHVLAGKGEKTGNGNVKTI